MIRYATGQMLKLTNIIIISAWLTALTIALLIHVDTSGFSSWTLTDNSNTTFHCIPPQDSSHQGYNTFAAVLAFIFPVCAILILYTAIIIKLRRYHKSNKAVANSKLKEERVEDRSIETNLTIPSPKVSSHCITLKSFSEELSPV